MIYDNICHLEQNLDDQFTPLLADTALTFTEGPVDDTILTDWQHRINLTIFMNADLKVEHQG